MLKHVFGAPFPRAKRSLGAGGALIYLIVAVVALDFVQSRQREHSSSCCSSGVAKRSSTTRTAAMGCLYALLAGGEQHVPRRVVVSSSGSSNSSGRIVAVKQASIGAAAGCDRVFCGLVGDTVGSKAFSIEQSDPRIPLKNSTFSTGCADRIARSKKLGSKRHFFDCVRMPDFVSDQKSPFSIHRSDCIRIGLTSGNFSEKSGDTPIVAHVNHRLPQQATCVPGF